MNSFLLKARAYALITTAVFLALPVFASDDLVVSFSSGTSLTLNGVANLAATNEFLKPYGLEAFPQNDMATVAITGVEYNNVASAYGSQVTRDSAPFPSTYHELFATIYVRKIGDTTSAPSFVFTASLLDNSKMVKAYKRYLHLSASQARLAPVYSSDGATFLATSWDTGKMTLAKLVMASGQPTQSVPFSLDATAYSLSSRHQKPIADSYRFTARGVALARPYDSSVGDSYLPINAELGAFLSRVKFSPTLWLYQQGVSGETWSLNR